MKAFNPRNWYWIVNGDATRVFSSKSGDFVPVNDATYVNWLADGTLPTRITSEAELGEVLAQYRVRPTVAGLLDGYLDKQAGDLVDTVQFKVLFNHENRLRAIDGRLAVYRLPSNDGGGTYEVAGINDRYHPQQAAKLKALIEAGKHDEAELAAADYLIAYTNVAAGWTPHAGVEFYLRDAVFNRGPRGAARILQRALGVEDDGEIGPTTRAAMDNLAAAEILTKLRAGREDYERNVVGFRANFWRGLVNRWDKALVKAREFQKEQGALPPAIKRAVEVGAGGAVAAANFWDWIVAHPFLSVVTFAAATAATYYAIHRFNVWRNRAPPVPTAPVQPILES